MKNYKGTKFNMECLWFKFELGKRYSVKGELCMCENGFHSCDELKDVVEYYDIASSRFFEVDVEDTIKGKNKNCSRHITFVRELTFYEVMRALNFREDGSPLRENQENSNVGFFNHGNGNHGNGNQGNHNQGNYNQGNNNYGSNNCGNNNYGNGNRGNGNYGNDNA